MIVVFILEERHSVALDGKCRMLSMNIEVIVFGILGLQAEAKNLGKVCHITLANGLAVQEIFERSAVFGTATDT